MDDKPERILWFNTKEISDISRQVGHHLAGCHFELVNMSVETNGVLSESNALLILEDSPAMTPERARQNLGELVGAGLIQRDGETLTLTVFGKTVVPDFDDWDATD